MQIFSLNWLSHKKKPKKKIPKKLKNARPHRHGNSLYNIYTYIYALLSKTQTTIRSTKTKNKLTKKKHTKTPNEKPKKKKHMTWNETKSNTMPRLFCSQSPTFPHTSPTKRVHSPTKLFLYTYRTVYLTQNKIKKNSKTETKPKPRCET